MSIKKVAVIGATGSLGSLVTPLLTSSGFSVTILCRSGSSAVSNPPPSTTVKPIDSYSDIPALTAALSGIDAVVSTTGMSSTSADQNHIIDAAIAAGVKFFIPAEYGADYNNPKNRKVTHLADKIETRDYLEEKSKEGKISWTAVSTGAFLDWGLETGFLGISVESKTATLYNGGNIPFSATLLSDIAIAVKSLLQHPDREVTKNRAAYVNSTIITQKQLLGIVERVLGEKLQVNNVETKEEDFEAALWSKDARGSFEGKEISELLGIEKLGENGLEKLVEKILKG